MKIYVMNHAATFLVFSVCFATLESISQHLPPQLHSRGPFADPTTPSSPTSTSSALEENTMANHFRLLDLIPELRLEIYGHVFVGTTMEPIEFTGATGFRCPPPPLLLTCKQIYREALSAYYSSLTIVVPNLTATPGMLADFVPREHWGRLRALTVDATRPCEASAFIASTKRDTHAIVRDCVVEVFGKTEEGRPLSEKVKIVCTKQGCKLPQGKGLVKCLISRSSYLQAPKMDEPTSHAGRQTVRERTEHRKMREARTA